jgi:ribosomal protein S18 acetylase RimI-like enzyme
MLGLNPLQLAKNDQQHLGESPSLKIFKDEDAVTYSHNNIQRSGAAAELQSASVPEEFCGQVLERIVFLNFAAEAGSYIDQSLELIKGSLAGLADDSPVADAIERRLAQFHKVYRREGSGLLAVVSQGGTVAATVGYGSFANLPLTESTCEIRDLAVAPSARGMGLGKRLLMLALQHATNIGYREFYLETTAKMKPAMRLFTKIGFEAVKHQNKLESTLIKPKHPATKDQVPCYFHCDNWRRFLPYGAK